MKDMYAQLLEDNSPLLPSSECGDNALSIGRFAMEHWVFSHPHVQPCQTLGKDLSYAKVRAMEPWGWTPQLGKKIPNTKFYGIFKEPWFQQEGRLYEYNYLYGEEPPKKSWFWHIYRNHKMTTTTQTTKAAIQQVVKKGNDYENGQRMVILLGPAVKNIFRHFVALKKKEKLGNWTVVGRKSLLPAMKAMFTTPKKRIAKTSTFSKIQNSWKHGRSIVLGGAPELLDSLVHWNDDAFPILTGLFPKNVVVNVILMYQTPRSSHLISVYEDAIMAGTFPLLTEQQTPAVVKGNGPTATSSSLSEWLCHGDSIIMEKLVSAQLNPMGVAHAFVRAYGNASSVTIADMSGMVEDDVPTQVVCEVLRVAPCNDTVVTNTTPRNKVLTQLPPGLMNLDLLEIETILRRMDCHSYCGLRGNLTILHEKDDMFSDKEGWNQCCASPEKSLSPLAAYAALQNVGCRAFHRERATATTTTQHVGVPAKREMVKRVTKVVEPSATTTTSSSSLQQVQQDSSPPRGVVVLGMHRSGTSLLAGLLVEGFGYTVGGPLLQPKGENAKGYYERRDVVLENMNLLKQQGAHWHKAVEKYKYSVPLTLSDKGQRALQFMRTTQNNNNTPWLIKDPRLCITLPTWPIQQAPAIVFTYRHPMQVASSLEERDIPVERGLELWIVYNKRAIQNSQHLCRVLTSNSAILANPLEESTRIVEELVQKCHLQRPPGHVTRDLVDRFVDSSLQHHTTKDDEGGCHDYNMSEESDMYKMAMKVYCDLQSGEAYKPDYKWPIGVDRESGQGVNMVGFL
jgi:hypothetical protein